MFGGSLTIETDRLVAANDRSRQEIVASLERLRAQLAELMGELRAAVSAGNLAAAERLEAIAAGVAAQLQEVQNLNRETQLQNVHYRASAR